MQEKDLLSAMMKSSEDTPTLLVIGPLLSLCITDLILTSKKHSYCSLVSPSCDTQHMTGIEFKLTPGRFGNDKSMFIK